MYLSCSTWSWLDRATSLGKVQVYRTLFVEEENFDHAYIYQTHVGGKVTLDIFVNIFWILTKPRMKPKAFYLI